MGSCWSLKSLPSCAEWGQSGVGSGVGLSFVASVPTWPRSTTLSAQPCTLGGLSRRADKEFREGSPREGGSGELGPALSSVSLPFRRPLVRPLQSSGPRVRQSGRQAEGRGLGDQTGEGRRHRGVRLGPAARRPRLPHHQVLQAWGRGVPPGVHRCGLGSPASAEGWGPVFRNAEGAGPWTSPRSGSSSAFEGSSGPGRTPQVEGDVLGVDSGPRVGAGAPRAAWPPATKPGTAQGFSARKGWGPEGRLTAVGQNSNSSPAPSAQPSAAACSLRRCWHGAGPFVTQAAPVTTGASFVHRTGSVAQPSEPTEAAWLVSSDGSSSGLAGLLLVSSVLSCVCLFYIVTQGCAHGF